MVCLAKQTGNFRPAKLLLDKHRHTFLDHPAIASAASGGGAARQSCEMASTSAAFILGIMRCMSTKYPAGESALTCRTQSPQSHRAAKVWTLCRHACLRRLEITETFAACLCPAQLRSFEPGHGRHAVQPHQQTRPSGRRGVPLLDACIDREVPQATNRVLPYAPWPGGAPGRKARTAVPAVAR
jgi:hypothetical protein